MFANKTGNFRGDSMALFKCRHVTDHLMRHPAKLKLCLFRKIIIIILNEFMVLDNNVYRDL